VKTKVWFCF